VRAVRGTGVKYCDTCHTTYPNEFTTCPRDQNVLRQTSELLQGMIIRDKYEILEKIGAGGMAAVYRARHLAFNEVCAIKVVGSRLLDDEAFLKRFRTEAVVTRKLQHPNAVRVDDLDMTEDGRPFIVMELVQGRDLRKVIQQEGPLPIARAVEIARQVAAALAAAHALGITHRDIKPDNILLIQEQDGRDLVKVLDFGIAKVREGAMDMGEGYTTTKTGMVVGTPQYISPEQAMGKAGEAIDGRADLYSLGVVLYEMLVGKLPFESDTPVGLLLHHIQTVPKPPHVLRPELGIPESLSLLLMKLLEKDRARRLQTAAELIAALEQAAEQFAGTVVMGSDALNRPASRRAPPPVTPSRLPTPPYAATPPRTPPAPSPPPAARPAAAPARPVPVARPASPPPLPRRPAPSVPWMPPAEKEGWGRPLVITLVILALSAGGGYYYLQIHNQPQPQPAAVVEPAAVNDETILAEVNRVLASSELLQRESVKATVADGVVTLSGKTGSPYAASMAGALVQGLPGVKQVQNQIVVEEPSAAAAPPASSPPPASPTETRAEPRVPVQKSDTSAAEERRARQRENAEKLRARAQMEQLLRTGAQQARDGDYASAIQSFESALDIDPDSNIAQAGLTKAKRAQETEQKILQRRR